MYTEVAKKHAEKLESIKKNVTDWHGYFDDNIKRYHKFIRFVFKTALSDADLQNLASLEKPPIEFNILEAMISRLRGEFAKQEPSVCVRAADGIRVEELTPEFIDTMEVIEAHLREIFFDATNDQFEYNVYSDLLAGGFSVAEIYTDYINEMSFEQKIKCERVFDPTLTGFDPLARESHKGDGRYCFKIVPKTLDEFKAEFGEEAAKDFKMYRETAGGFNWSYKNQEQEIVLVCDYFEKKMKRTKIVKLSNGHTITKQSYKEIIKMWEDMGFIEQPPIILSERTTNIETICRYRFCENKVLDYVETDYKFLPLVFIDGNSVNMVDTNGGASYQMCRPFVYHAEGVQKLKNFSGQTVASEIQNMVQHRIKVPLAAIPIGYEGAYKNVQVPNTLVYNHVDPDNPDVPLPPPMEIQRTPTPPIVENTFMGTDQTTQMILGSYDSVLGTNSNQLSGVAIQQGALQSNAAAIPYLMGYIKGLNRIAQIIVDLIPKYYRTPRSLPVRKANGKRSFQIINDQFNPNSISMSYDPNNLSIKVEAGVNSTIQKQVALEEITRMMQASPLFAQFMNEMGLETLLDNMDIRGIDHLKAQAEIFMQKVKESQNQEQPPSDAQMLAEAEIEKTQIITNQKQMQAEGEMMAKAAQLAIEKQKVDLQFAQLMANVEQNQLKSAIEQEKIDAEDARTAVDTAIKVSKHLHESMRKE